MNLLGIEAPHGPVWVFLAVVLVLVAGPALVERARLSSERSSPVWR